MLLFHFRLSYTYYTKSLRQTGVHLLRPPSRVRKKFRELKPQTLCPPQDITFCPLYSYKYSIFLWVTCSYRKECPLKSNEQLVAPCQALLAPAFACSTYICILANTPRSHPPTAGKKLWPSPPLSCLLCRTFPLPGPAAPPWMRRLI